MPNFRRTNAAHPANLPIHGSQPKQYTVNLDLPPRQRYIAIATDYKDHMRELTPLFAQVIGELGLPSFTPLFARYILRKVYTAEEQEEILGLVELSGIPLYLIVAFNSFLDVLMGCTSGAVRLGGGSGRRGQSSSSSSSTDGGARAPIGNTSDDSGNDNKNGDTVATGGEDRMVHFRTLDWEMDKLREVIIQVEYTRKGQVVARAVTYAGYIGILTGVRPGLSISLNFRENISPGTPSWQLYLQQLLVLLGVRQSISSILRQLLLGSTTSSSSSSQKGQQQQQPDKRLPSLQDIIQTFPKSTSAPCYITLCDGQKAVYIEKDIHTAKVYTSDTFISCTNHDEEMEKVPIETMKDEETREDVQESIERKMNVKRMYEEITKAGMVEEQQQQQEEGLRRSVRLQEQEKAKKSQKMESGESQRRDNNDDDDDDDGSVGVDDVARWLETYPTWNECTHLACIMDPTTGEMLWARKYLVE